MDSFGGVEAYNIFIERMMVADEETKEVEATCNLCYEDVPMSDMITLD